MKRKNRLKVKVKNAVLYDKVEMILKKYNIKPFREGKMDWNTSFQLIGNNECEMYLGGQKDVKLSDELFPNNLYDISPFLFLYLLRAEEYPLEVFYDLRKCFVSHFSEITDGYELVEIKCESFNPLIDNDEEIGFSKQHKTLRYKDGKLFHSEHFNIQTEVISTPARIIYEKEKDLSKVESDRILYNTALDAFQIEE